MHCMYAKQQNEAVCPKPLRVGWVLYILQYGRPQRIWTHWTDSICALNYPMSCTQYAYLYIVYTHTHTLNSNKHMNTLHMCCITSIHVCNSCNSCVAVCTWINSKAWTGSQLKTTTYVRVLIMTMVETPHGQRSEIPRGPDVSRDSSGSRSGAIRSCRAHLWCSTSSDCSQAAGQFPFTLFPILFVSLSFW